VTDWSTEAPRPKTIQVALRKTTEALAQALATADAVLPDWSEFEWRIARAAAAIHGVSPLLASLGRWEGPSGWVQFLDEQRQNTACRQRRIEELTSVIDARARRHGLPLVALKGAALHAMGLYVAGERPMADLDLLGRGKDMAGLVRMLEDLGFRESWTSWKHRVLVPENASTPAALGEHADNDIKLELHERIGEILPLHVTDITPSVYPADPRPGLNPYRSRAALMAHLLLHAAGAMAYRRLRLVNIHDLALLSSRMTDEDWEQVLAIGATARDPWWALPPLELTARYYRAHVPDRVLSELERRCTWLLSQIARRRMLSDVSLSYIWVEAFPGIEWAQSVSEMIAYVVSRVRPSKETLEMRAALASTEAWASKDPWYPLCHRQRMLRFAMSRVTRAATMHAVHGALAHSP
jgi:hypothetical protein